MKTTELTARLNEIVGALREEVGASRVTLRLDSTEHGFHVGDVAAEALAPGITSLRGQTSIRQRESPTVQWLERERRPLVQNDLRGADPAPPRALTDIYGTTAQMLGPIFRSAWLMGWVSVHYNGGAREWRPAEVTALERTVAAVQQALDAARPKADPLG